MSSNHPYRYLNIPKDAPIELKPSAGKGWGVFAKQKIQRGALILQEKPLFVIRKARADITEEDVGRAFQQLSPQQKQQFALLRDNATRIFPCLLMAFAENCFNLASGSDAWVSLPPAEGLFLLHSRFNHSCLPNAKVPTGIVGDEIASFATRDILAGEEITICYGPVFECLTRQERHQALGFTCDCRACLPGTPFQRLSDARRRLSRGLQYLTQGVDVDVPGDGGLGTSSLSPVIVDPQLWRAAQNFDIPLTSRFIYGLLGAFLWAEAGLLDDFLFQRATPSIRAMVGMFRTHENAAIARLALVQDTWLERLSVAFRVYGREDVADQSVAGGLRVIERAASLFS
ncbi:0f64f5e1-8546-4b25-b755-685281cc512f [Thermothielavioides terrestris]|uniref:0f64f5e1-8546-4b25-b755-685281cc512f n=1 Tax=Thermothielavioides terrestris TaxID=2587410 RepID=A0A446BTG8_9PEZI|nr:0f64f5e1-8546-4b25-b755-685281cc512f [Thermothielavioides terrestris]